MARDLMAVWLVCMYVAVWLIVWVLLCHFSNHYAFIVCVGGRRKVMPQIFIVGKSINSKVNTLIMTKLIYAFTWELNTWIYKSGTHECSPYWFIKPEIDTNHGIWILRRIFFRIEHEFVHTPFMYFPVYTLWMNYLYFFFSFHTFFSALWMNYSA